MLFDTLFYDLRLEFKKYDDHINEAKKSIAPDFNAFEILYALELPLSRILGDFLNPQGKHAQGQIFLDLFIYKFLDPRNQAFKSKKVNLTIEHAVPNGRIDILIDFDSKFAIAIENKPFATDQDHQIIGYVNYLESIYGRSNYRMIYLSADGSKPSELSLSKNDIENLGDQFLIISYPQIKTWLMECAEKTRVEKSERLTILILELAEYINRIFCKTNSLKDKMIGKAIKNNILEAFELNRLWNKNLTDFESTWKNKINELMNKELPELVYERLLKQGVLNSDWEFVEGKFDINKKHLEGFRFKKKSWKKLSIGISSTAHDKKSGTQIFFPIISSNNKIDQATNEQTERYNMATNCNWKTNWFGSRGKVFWAADFPDNNYYSWDYDQWSEIKKDGKTVEYLADFFSKLIPVCTSDIDKIENPNAVNIAYTEDDFKRFVNQFQWTFAKTYAEKGPHEYIVLAKVGLQHKNEFIKVAKFIREKGFKANYYSREGYYYKLDENYYWTMDEDIADTDLINRAKWADYELIDNSWYWKGRQ